MAVMAVAACYPKGFIVFNAREGRTRNPEFLRSPSLDSGFRYAAPE
jgi:hypothetical protein